MDKRILFALAVLISACGHKYSTASGSVSPNLPEAPGGGNATQATQIGSYTLGEHIVLDTSDNAPRNGNPFSCFGPVPADFAIGRLVCATDPNQSLPVTGANVDLICSVDPKYGTTAAAQPLSSSTCKTFDLYVITYNPPLAVSVR